MARAEQSLGFHVLLALACILCLASCAESRTAAANRRQQVSLLHTKVPFFESLLFPPFFVFYCLFIIVYC
uniref:Uncharacterized protein n=1 Tax=Nelumbo nucifera TaxID=4432 RepID=A0A822YWE5_NELNU|nr:TPA_asm: hypothetical protein HUJ06_009055 [Nelumbo nucifera]